MISRFFSQWLLFVAGLALSISLHAAETETLLQAKNNLGDQASLQRGAKLFMGYCSACHSLKYLRYSRMAEDLHLSEDGVMNNLNFTGAAVGEHIHVAMPHDAAVAWFGNTPPDLSLVARVRGSDWVYTYLKSFYLDQSQALGWNNALLPNASMPNALWELQGLQHAQYGPEDPKTKAKAIKSLEVMAPGVENPVQFDRSVRDITNFLEYASEPAALKRRQVGWWVILFLAALTFLAFLLKREFWKDVH